MVWVVLGSFIEKRGWFKGDRVTIGGRGAAGLGAAQPPRLVRRDK